MKAFAVFGLCALAIPAFADNHPNAGVAAIAEREAREFRTLLAGFFANEEQVYFQANQELPEHLHAQRREFAVTVSENVVTFDLGDDDTLSGTVVPDTEHGGIDVEFGDDCLFNVAAHEAVYTAIGQGRACEGQRLVLSDSGLSVSSGGVLPEGRFDRARAFSCWVAPRKRDGEYGFVNNVQLHTSGGRQWVSGEGFDTVGLRMRHVRWPMGRNRDSLVLYIHRADDTDWKSAESYAWTEPEASRIAVNLRWVQASCTEGEADIKPGINLTTGSGN